MKLYNTLTRKKQLFKPLKAKTVSLYSCGPTVYNYSHIGNLRTYIFADTLKRALMGEGYAVKHIINITDVGHLTSDGDEGEDKLEKGAAREKKTVWQVAKHYTEAFKRDAEALNILPPKKWTKATDHIKEQVALITALEKKGYAYEGRDAVYFDTKKFRGYGKLTGQKADELETGAGTKSTRRKKAVTIDTEKRNPRDFVLWFKRVGQYKNHVMHWPSPWGDGFPGWHIECSAMSMKYLGKTFDIHTGGVDHIGTHHTNEIAQSEGATGKPFVRYWLHGEFLGVAGEDKMAKSGESFLILNTLIKKGFDPLDYRYLIVTAHYRAKITFSWKALEGAARARKNLTALLEKSYQEPRRSPTAQEKKRAAGHEKKFRSAIADDLNTPQALAEVWAVAKGTLPARTKKKLIKTFDAVLGLKLGDITKEAIPEKIQRLVDTRELSRDRKQFTHADDLRKQIEALGYTVEDTSWGAVVRKK